MQSFKCNSCLHTLQLFVEPTTADSPQNYLSQCKHIFCADCYQKSRPNCGFCRRGPTRFIKIQKGMPFQFRIMFTPLPKIFEIVRKAITFQVRHQEWNIDRLRQKNERYEQHKYVLRQKVEELDGKSRNIAEKNDKLKFIISKVLESKKKQERLNRRKRSPTPLPTPRTHQKRKYMFRPNRYANAEPVSPRRLPCASLSSSILYNPQQRKPTQRPRYQ